VTERKLRTLETGMDGGNGLIDGVQMVISEWFCVSPTARWAGGQAGRRVSRTRR
jgi:hypothetical protein